MTDPKAIRILTDVEKRVGALEVIEAAGGGGIITALNTSGAAAAANDVGYIDAAGEYKTTGTQYHDGVAWCVVATGGANNATIEVAVRGRVTVQLDANCAIGDYLYTSGTATQASVLSYARPGLLGVAQTANAAGAGGTCTALLLCQRVPRPMSNASYVFSNFTCSDSDWRATQNGAPAGAVITYNVPLVSGSEDAIENPAASLGRIVVHNTTRGELAYIASVNTGANTITVTAAADVAAWVNGDSLSCRSQVVLGIPFGGTCRCFDIYLSTANVPALAVGLRIGMTHTDTGAGWAGAHPFEVYADSKLVGGYNPAANVYYTDNEMTLDFINRRFCVIWDASGVATLTRYVYLRGVILAAP